MPAHRLLWKIVSRCTQRNGLKAYTQLGFRAKMSTRFSWVLLRFASTSYSSARKLQSDAYREYQLLPFSGLKISISGIEPCESLFSTLRHYQAYLLFLEYWQYPKDQKWWKGSRPWAASIPKHWTLAAHISSSLNRSRMATNPSTWMQSGRPK